MHRVVRMILFSGMANDEGDTDLVLAGDFPGTGLFLEAMLRVVRSMLAPATGRQSVRIAMCHNQALCIISRREQPQTQPTRLLFCELVETTVPNMQISERRARAVADKLLEMGVSANRLTVEGRGHYEPAVVWEGPESDAANRRVELTIFDPTGSRTPLPFEPTRPFQP